MRTMRNNNYFIKEYTYKTRDYGELTGSSMKIWDGNNPYYFFKEISKSLYNYFMQRHKDAITIIVWKGVLYEYVNPEDVFKGLFTFRSIYGNEHSIDLRGYLAAKRHVEWKSA